MKLLLVLLCVLYMPFGFAKDHGVMGRTWVIAETDFLDFIQNKVKAMQENGQWQKLESAFVKRVKAHVTRPEAVHLPRAEKDKTWLFDPSIEVPHTIYDVEGKVIVQRGVIVNPLDRVNLSSTLIFLDGDDPEQIAWAKNMLEKQEKIKLILTSGSIRKSTDEFRQAVYFDLNAFLTDKFHIKALPALVKQAQNRLMIQEVSL